MPKQRDTTSLVKAVATVIRDHVTKAFKPLLERIEAVEQRFSDLPVPKDGENGKDGRNAFEVAVSLGYEGTVHEWMASLQGQKGEDGEDGKSVTIDDVRPLIEDAVKALPVPKDGKDGKDGENGTSVTLDDVRPLIEQAVKAIPVPKDGKDGRDGRDGEDGKSVTADEVLPGLKAELQTAVEALPIPKDGKDGIDGKDGKSVTVEEVRHILDAALARWELEAERRANDLIQRCIDRIPKPQDGKPGRDAFDIEDVQLSLADDERTLTLAFMRGEERVERSIVLTHPIYRGVWREGEFRKGDCVTFGGSSWIAVRDTKAKPETDDSWRLSVKRGRDGKDGQKGDRGDRGPPGKVAA